MNEEGQTPDDADVDVPATHDPDDADTAELVALAGDDEKSKKLIGALIASKKELRASRAKIKELEPVAARSAAIEQQLQQVSPFIDALASSPQLRAQALRAANGTRPSAASSDQPVDDPDASAMAEEFGFYLPDGQTPDLARGRRVLDRLDKRNEATTRKVVAPYASSTLGQQAIANLREVQAMTDDDGVPLATKESIEEVFKMLPPELVASDGVRDLALQVAIGRDRLQKRTPKAVDEPLYTAASGGRRVTGEGALTAEDRAFCERNGIDPKRYGTLSRSAEQGGRQGVVLGGKR